MRWVAEPQFSIRRGVGGGEAEHLQPRRSALEFLPAVKFWQSDLRISWSVAW
jgi:hypothetical protein